MIKIMLICVGKLKEKFFLDAAEEYIKRLSRFCALSMVEIEPAKLPSEPSDAEINKALETEGDKILRKIPDGAFVSSLCIEGSQKDSVTLSADINSRANFGFGTQVFIIGGSYGLCDAVKARSNENLSMSKMTFPHKLARIMLLEQIYRAFMISDGGTYHK